MAFNEFHRWRAQVKPHPNYAQKAWETLVWKEYCYNIKDADEKNS